MRAYRKLTLRIGPTAVKARILVPTSSEQKGPKLESRSETGSEVRQVYLDPVLGEVPKNELVKHYKVTRKEPAGDLYVRIPQDEIDACGLKHDSMLDFRATEDVSEIPDHAVLKTYLMSFEPETADIVASLHRTLKDLGKVLVAESVIDPGTRRPLPFILRPTAEGFIFQKLVHKEYWHQAPEIPLEGGEEHDGLMQSVIGSLGHGLPADKWAPSMHRLVESKLTPEEADTADIMQFVKDLAS